MAQQFLHKAGDWTKASRLLRRSRFVQVITRAPDKILNKAALMLQREIKVGIARNRLGLAPLAPSTLAEKSAKNYSSNPLVRTGELVRSVTLVKKQNFIFVGVPRGVGRYSYGSKGDIMNVAKLLHDGLRSNLPERPFIILAYNKIDKKIEDMVRKAARKALVGF